MSKGFVTIATGNDRYYRMARNLLRSYRQNCSTPVPFAIIADRENEYTKEFDNVVILDNPTHSWMDKMRLLDVCPYDESLFIDADCLVYQDINFLWDLYSDADDFSCFGEALPLDAQGGWFTAQAAAFYPIQFCTHLHGMLYFIRKSDMLKRMQSVCDDIIENYSKIQFRGFNDQLADEPVYALAMAVLGLHPVCRKAEYYCFRPFANRFSSNYACRAVQFENEKDGFVKHCCVVHWGNKNTLRAQYRFDARAVNREHLSANTSLGYRLLYRYGFLLTLYRIRDFFSDLWSKTVWFFAHATSKVKRTLFQK